MAEPSRPQIEQLGSTTNAVVVRIPPRRFPGIVIQGDSLKSLFDIAVEIRDQLDEQSKAHSSASELYDLLRSYLTEYERVLRAGGVGLP